MDKSWFEQLDGKYEKQGDSLIPRLTLPAGQEPVIGIWGSGTCTYIHLLTSRRRNAYLADIVSPARERFEKRTEQMKQTQGATAAKGANALEWTGRMHSIRACARGIGEIREIVEREIISQ